MREFEVKLLTFEAYISSLAQIALVTGRPISLSYWVFLWSLFGHTFFHLERVKK